MKPIDADVLKEWVENWLYKDRYYHNGKVSKTIPITELYDILEQLPSAQPTQNNDSNTLDALDCVSRQAAIAEFSCCQLPPDGGIDANYAIDFLKQMPSAQRTGKWERHYSRPNVYADLYWHCSECGYKNDDQYANVYHKFCPNCGAKMEVQE